MKIFTVLLVAWIAFDGQYSKAIQVTKRDLNEIMNQAEVKVRRRLEIIEPSIFSNGAIQVPGSHGWFLAASSRTKILAKNYSKSALIAEETSKIIATTYRLSHDEIVNDLPRIDIKGTSLSNQCPRQSVQLPCHPGKYRSFSGHCNNVQNADWGNSVTEYQRFLSPSYHDSLANPRKSVMGDDLPSARDISYLIHQGSEQEHPHITTLMVFFGEFVFHDLQHTAQMVGHRGHRIKCCGLSDDLKHPECMPISVSRDDMLHTTMKQNCLDYVRSCPAIRRGCTLGPRDQTNQVTAFLDGSAIYGSSEDESRIVRAQKSGLLKSQKVKQSGKEWELLPAMDGQHDCRGSNENVQGKGCFYAGDIRVNENVGLTMMHTLWMREHNRIARTLTKLNPHQTDEQIFQETRRIVAAKLQHIVYNELLPAILGSEVMTEYDLNPLSDGYYSGYDMKVNPGIDNAVATAVMPFLYSMLPSRLERYSHKLSMLGTRKMSETYFNPSDLYDVTKFTEYLMGLISQNALMADVYVSKEIANNVALEAREGTDLVAAIIQQGRDHGLPSYVEVRKFCAIEPQIKTWNDLSSVLNSSIVMRLATTYKSIKDIDLYTGGLAETPLLGAVVGPTFACLLARQFNNLRRGDRYWYENDLPPSAFSREQLNEIRKATLASVVCNNNKDMDFVQPSSMVLSDAYLNAFQYCTNIPDTDLRKWKSRDDPSKISEALMKETINKAKEQILSIRNMERNAFERRRGIATPTSPAGAHLAMTRPKRQALEISNQSLIYEIVTNNFVRSLLQQNKDRENPRSLRVEVEELMSSLPQVDLTELLDLKSAETVAALRPDQCSEELNPCDHTSPFRTLTGWCNNLKNPELGNSFKLHDRLLAPSYEDGVSVPRRKTKSGKNLPSPRIISTTMHYDIPSPHSRYALVTMQWGQFLDHDITLTPSYLGPENSILDCKACDSPKTVHPECWPIPIPKNDPHFPWVNSTTGKRQCLHFVRSLNGQTKLGPREQINQLTPLIDASNVYGSDPCEAATLRTFERGRLNSTVHPLANHKDLLPQTNKNPECKAPSGICFDAGDHRASEQPSLACMHTIWMRQHNKLADELASVNPHWNDEQIYQTARKIVGAMVQRINYNEFLPRVLGLEYMRKYDLFPLNSGYFTGYDDNCRPVTFNEFSAAVFRFGHSLLKPSFQRLGRAFRAVDENLKLRTAFFNSDMLYSAQAIDALIRGIVTMSVETLDNMITDEVTNHLFEEPKVPFSGMDLISLNIQRGRDHALPPYNEVREFCNLTRAKSFDDLRGEITPNLIARLKKIYESVDDIDLFTGGISETSLHGGSVGPTFGCVVGLQFQRLKKCDRFWYETDQPYARFTEAQLNEIRKVTLAKVLCENSDSINVIQKHVMDLPDSFLNPRVSCSSMPSPDMTKWTDTGNNCLIAGKFIKAGRSARPTPCTMCSCTNEGAVCNSIKIKNCFSLISSFNINDVLSDSVCSVQCSFAMKSPK
ncbi:uncharacterized protein LOC141857262 [Brevipalpus obovatus]|uniref:uncharacterized protein LOC141857262 n=1 Tax=Brevipalpus obovatus TaxID=246614 RepID=UPI003D9E12A3